MKKIAVVSGLAFLVIIIIYVITKKKNSVSDVVQQSDDSFINDFFGLESSMNLTYFSESEFGGWFENVNPDALKKLDQFRHEWGFPVEVSPHEDAVGRHGGDSTSQHNIDRFGMVNAIDVFPKNSVGGYINSQAERKRAFEIAKNVGFTGIGVYTDTSPGNMLHVDVRSDRSVGDPATWSRINGEFDSIYKVV